ncbi:hypothetical protein GCM10009566_04010 [Streptomyces murinus]
MFGGYVVELSENLAHGVAQDARGPYGADQRSDGEVTLPGEQMNGTLP